MEIGRNTGVLDERPKGTDYLADIVSGVTYNVVNPSGDWTDRLPTGETQTSNQGDTFACVTFSALNCIETLLSERTENFSDRFTAKMSGTTKAGNYLSNVAESIRRDGVVYESQWPTTTTTWDEYYSPIPQAVKDLGRTFTKIFTVQWEWVPTDKESLKKHLKQAPLQIVTRVCNGWNNPPVKGCGIGTDHATMLYKIDDEGYHIFDHYAPYKKVLLPDYGIQTALKYVLIDKQPIPMLDKFKGKLVRNTKTGAFGLCLGHEILVAEGSDRSALLALDTMIRAGYGVNISPEEWDSVSHRPF